MPELTCTTWRTPGTALALSALKLATLPPNTGLLTILAVSSPGSLTSMPKRAVPFTFSGRSSRGSDWPSSLKLAGAFSVICVGTGSAAALSTSAP